MSSVFAVIEWLPTTDDSFPGREPIEIARLLVRIRTNAEFEEVVLRPTVVVLEEQGLETEFQSGGKVFPPDTGLSFSPASVTPGRVRVEGGFRRGDSNDDGSVNLSDATTTLNHLFAGGSELVCQDAADADDNGELQLSDAVLLLVWLFGAGEAPPAPYPDCGVDPTQDDVSCDRSNCEAK